MTTKGTVRVDPTPPAARVRFCRPPLNVLDVALIRDIDAALEGLEGVPELSVVVLEAEGASAFSAGVEIRDHFPERVPAMLAAFHGLCRRLEELPQVTVAVVRGLALGGAVELLSCCDFVVATDEAELGQPEIDVGCFPPLAAARYPGRLGPRWTAEIVLLGRRLSATEAREAGLVSHVVPGDGVDQAVAGLVGALTAKSPAVLRLAKRALVLGRRRGLEALPLIERLYIDELAATDDMLEGLRAFLEKRPPRWKGR